jgi:hypothetical protein
MTLPTDIHLVWTTKGNLPVMDLEHQVEWRVEPDQIIFTESYLLDGEVVKQSSHVRVLTGVAMSGEASI